MRAARVIGPACGLLLLTLPSVLGPASTRLLLPTGVAALLVGAIWRRPAATTLAAGHGVVATALAVSAAGTYAGALLGGGAALLLTGLLLGAELVGAPWSGPHDWWRRRRSSVAGAVAAVAVLSAVATLPPSHSAAVFVAGMAALALAAALAMPRHRRDGPRSGTEDTATPPG